MSTLRPRSDTQTRWLLEPNCIPRPAVTRASPADRPPEARSGTGEWATSARSPEARVEGGVTFPPPTKKITLPLHIYRLAYIGSKTDNAKRNIRLTHMYNVAHELSASQRTDPLPASNTLHAHDDFALFADSNTQHVSYSAIGPQCEPETTGGPASAIHREWARRS